MRKVPKLGTLQGGGRSRWRGAIAAGAAVVATVMPAVMPAPPASADPAAEAQGPARFGDTRKLIDLSDVVIVGKVEKGKRTDNADNPDAVTTVINVSVARAFKGTPGKTVAVRQRGGDLGDGTAIDSSLNAHLEEGERVVLYLRDNGDGTYRTVMGHLGAVNEHLHAGRETIANPLFDDDPSDVTVGSACDSAGPGFSGYSMIFDSNGKHMVWSGQTMTWKISTNYTSQQSAADAAMATWNAAGGLFSMVNGGATTAVATNQDSDSVISHENISDPTVLGYADFRRVIATGALTTADIHMNSNKSWSAGTGTPTSTQYDTMSVLIHEMAHGLGAGHVSDSGQVTYPCLSAGVTKRTLGWGDRAMHRNFYPANDEGYWMVDARGNVYGLGGYGSFNKYNGAYHGGAGAYISTSHSAVDIERKRPTYDGYWILGSNGGVYAFDAPFRGSAAGDICGGCGTAVDMAVHPTGDWYAILTSTGQTYAYPNPGAPNYGGVTQWLTGGRYATGIATRPDGSAGWWIVNNLGEIYALGGAPYLGGGIPGGDQPAKGIIPTTSGLGYWVVGASGRVFQFGDAVGLAPSPQLSGTVKMDRAPTANALVGIASGGGTSFSGTTDYGRGTGQPAWGAIAAAKWPVAPTLTQTATPSAITVSRGQSSSFTVTDVSNETFFANVSYSLSGLPAGVGGSVSPNPVLLKSSSSASTTATISVPLAYTGPTTFNVTVTGCGQGICQNSTVSVAVLLV